MRTAELLAARDRARGSRAKLSGEQLFASLLRQDDRLVAVGFPPLTPWWREQLRDFYLSGKQRFVARVGRKGTKSSTLCRVAVNEVLNGAHVIRPGDVGLFMFVSENTDEAKKRIFMIKAILDALGVDHEPLDRDTRVVGTQLAFGVRAARIGAVSGPVVIGVVADEVAKWRDEATGANPATEVLRSLRPATVTQPNAHEFDISSPWSTIDAHAEMFADGNTADQMIAWAPSWVANPTISEADTRRLEKDEPTRQREYGAIPMSSGEVGFFDHGAIDEAAKRGAWICMPLVADVGTAITAGGDLAFEKDCATLAIGHRLGDWESDVARYRIADMVERRPAPGLPLLPGDVVAEFAAKLKDHRINAMMADGWYRMSAIEHLRAHKLHFVDAPTGQRGKAETYVRARVILHGGRLELPPDEKLIRQMKEVTSKATPGGGLTLSSPHKVGGGHGDMVSSVVLALWQRSGLVLEETDGIAPGTPEHQQREAKREAFKRAARRDRLAWRR